MSGRHRAGAALGALAAAMVWWNPAFAADEAPEYPDDAIPGDQIIVTGRAITATNTDTPIAETPQAISIVSEELFEDRGARRSTPPTFSTRTISRPAGPSAIASPAMAVR